MGAGHKQNYAKEEDADRDVSAGVDCDDDV